jgi:hypothetical protein
LRQLDDDEYIRDYTASPLFVSEAIRWQSRWGVSPLSAIAKGLENYRELFRFPPLHLVPCIGRLLLVVTTVFGRLFISIRAL